MKREDEDYKFVPWEKEESKRKPARGDGIPPLTSIKSRVHSKPKSEDQEYLDMYIMLKDKERLETYGKTLSKQHENVAESWKGTKKELLRRERKLPEIPKGGLENEEEKTNKMFRKTKKTPGNMKKLDWNY